MDMDLFDYSSSNINMPLAEKMRPKDLNEFFGQKHLVGKGTLLRNLIEQDKVISMILQGPPSTGKTSLAYIISQLTKSEFIKLNAVSLTISELRDTFEKAKDNIKMYDNKTIVFIDEIHAMKSNVQMALLPEVEKGIITLIGATTESVMHDIIPPLISRCKVYHLKPLSKGEIKEIILNALANSEKGLGDLNVSINNDTLEYLTDVCNGDIRSALNTLETASYSLKNSNTIELETIKESYELRLNNTSTSDFYNLTSAFIKSMRAGDSDGAIYWLARLLYAGVDPVYVARRIVVHSAEDVGMANPHALQIAIAAKEAVQFLGMPEARIPLAEAVIYICESPKSNSAYKAINSALQTVKNTVAHDVPNQIKDSSKDYINPIDHPKSQLDYLPKELKGTSFYKPQNSGVESKIYAKYNKQN
jgi:putative ATPase